MSEIHAELQFATTCATMTCANRPTVAMVGHLGSTMLTICTECQRAVEQHSPALAAQVVFLAA